MLVGPCAGWLMSRSVCKATCFVAWSAVSHFHDGLARLLHRPFFGRIVDFNQRHD